MPKKENEPQESPEALTPLSGPSPAMIQQHATREKHEAARAKHGWKPRKLHNS